MKIGGVSGWLQAAALGATAGLPLSSHLFPEVSAHLLAISPTAHWLEYVDWADAILREPLRIEEGHAVLPDSPGTGIEWTRMPSGGSRRREGPARAATLRRRPFSGRSPGARRIRPAFAAPPGGACGTPGGRRDPAASPSSTARS